MAFEVVTGTEQVETHNIIYKRTWIGKTYPYYYDNTDTPQYNTQSSSRHEYRLVDGDGAKTCRDWVAEVEVDAHYERHFVYQYNSYGWNIYKRSC